MVFGGVGEENSLKPLDVAGASDTEKGDSTCKDTDEEGETDGESGLGKVQSLWLSLNGKTA